MEFQIMPLDEAKTEVGVDGLEELLSQTTVDVDSKVQMISLNIERIESHKHQFIALDGCKAIGYIACTNIYSGNLGEVGGLIVHQDYRKHGIGEVLVALATGACLRAELHPMALCNPLSAPIFEAHDYQKTQLCDLPAEALIECDDCPKKKELKLGTDCCDRAYIYIESKLACASYRR